MIKIYGYIYRFDKNKEKKLILINTFNADFNINKILYFNNNDIIIVIVKKEFGIFKVKEIRDNNVNLFKRQLIYINRAHIFIDKKIKQLH